VEWDCWFIIGATCCCCYYSCCHLLLLLLLPALQSVKVGCAEGGCGACAVEVVQQDAAGERTAPAAEQLHGARVGLLSTSLQPTLLAQQCCL
jgi:aerobic-type carbon monoxide dehydrogenase small subunit (CoxS/CutS family)